MEYFLNLGSGLDYRRGYVNVDFNRSVKADKYLDLNELPYPFESNSFSEILMIRILEHLNNPDLVMKEIYRIAKPKAIIKIRVPHFSSIHTWADIEHKRGYSILTFIHQNLSDKFKVINQYIELPTRSFLMKPIAKFFPILYEKCFAYVFTATDLVIELEVKK